ncbi:MAG: phospholipid carrier-dependent glycosyltransferase [Polyangia bacterium]
MANVLVQIVTMSLLAGVLWLPGFAIERAALRKITGLPFRGLARLCLGTTSWVAAIFLLCACQCLTLLAVGALILASAAGAAPFLRRPRPRLPQRRSFAEVAAVAGCLLPILLALAVAAICSMDPQLKGDAGVYHLTIPKLYIAHGGFFRIPFNVYSNWPLNGEMVFALAMLLKDYVLANSVQCVFSVFVAIAVFESVRARKSAWYGFLAVLFMLFNHVLLREAATAYVDIIQAFFMATAFVFMLHAIDEPEQRRVCLLLSGISCGMMAGVKVSGFLGVVPIAAWYLLKLPRGGGRRRALLEMATWFVGPAVLLALPWGVKAAWFTGNPVYPLLYDKFGGPDWSQACWRQFVEWQSSMGMGRTLPDYVKLPYRVIMSGGAGYAHFDGSINRAWLALLPVSAVAAFWNRTVRACLLVGGVYFVCWASSSQQLRFLIPIIPVLAIGAALALGEIVDRLFWRRVASKVAFAATYCAAAGLLLAEVSGDLAKAAEMVEVYAAKDREAVMKSAVPAEFAFINRELPRDARLLFLNTNYGFYSEREYIADSFFEASQIVDWLGPCAFVAEIRARLRDKGITHVFYSTREGQLAYPAMLWKFLDDSSMVELLAKGEGLALFALK